MYYKKRLVMPIDANFGKPLISNMLLEATPEQKKGCYTIQKRYNTYIAKKKALLKEMSKKSKGIDKVKDTIISSLEPPKLSDFELPKPSDLIPF